MQEKQLRKIHHFHLALPADLFEKVKQVAERDHRSVTGQIICALEWMTREVENESTQSVVSAFGIMRALNTGKERDESTQHVQ